MQSWFWPLRKQLCLMWVQTAEEEMVSEAVFVTYALAILLLFPTLKHTSVNFFLIMIWAYTVRTSFIKIHKIQNLIKTSLSNQNVRFWILLLVSKWIHKNDKTNISKGQLVHITMKGKHQPSGLKTQNTPVPEIATPDWLHVSFLDKLLISVVLKGQSYRFQVCGSFSWLMFRKGW